MHMHEICALDIRMKLFYPWNSRHPGTGNADCVWTIIHLLMVNRGDVE